jgi:hypothetical protein
VLLADAARGSNLMRYVLLIVGGLMVFLGGVWLLQGVGILPGSFMTGQTFWAVAGAVVLLAGGALVFAGLRVGGRR